MCKKVGGDMATTVVQAILNPKYQKECFFTQIEKKVELCTEIKKLRTEITSQIDKEHMDMLQQYDELWDKLLGDMYAEATLSGKKLSEIL